MNSHETDWDLRFLQLAWVFSNYSKDSTTKHGTVIVGEENVILASGYNGLPRGLDDDPSVHPNWHDRAQAKYQCYEHSERNAIFNAARVGVRLSGSTIYVTGRPCADCCRAIIQTGIRRVVYTQGNKDYEDRWIENCNIGAEMLTEAGVAVECVQLTKEF